MNYYPCSFLCLIILITSCSNTPDRLTKKGIKSNEKKEYEAAINFFDKAISIDESYHYAIFQKGNSYYGLQDYQSASLFYRTALELDFNEFYAFNLGLSEMKLDNFKNALEAFELAENNLSDDRSFF